MLHILNKLGIFAGSNVFAGSNGFNLNNTKLVNSIADLPDPVGDVITTPSGMTYIWGPGVDMGTYRIELGANNAFLGFNISAPPVNYTGTDPFLINSSGRFTCNTMGFSTPNSVFILNTGATSRIVFNLVVGLSCVDFIHHNGLSFLISTSAVGTCVNGIVCQSATSVLGSVKELNFFNFTGTAIDLGVTLFDEYEQQDVIFTGSGLAMSTLPNSGNIKSGVVAPVSGCNFTGAGTALSGVSHGDARWDFQKNSGVLDSTYIGDSTLTAPQTVVVTTQGTFYPIGGVLFVGGLSERFTSNSAGVITYIGEKSINVLVIVTATLEKVGGGADKMCLTLSVGGVTQILSESCSTSSVAIGLTSQGVFQVNQGDEIYPVVSNDTGTANVIVDLCKISVINGF